MNDATLIILAIVIGTVGVTWAVGRLVDRLDDLLATVSAVVVRLGVATACALLAADLAMHGGYAWIGAALLGLVALWSLAIAASIIWASAHKPPVSSG